MSTPSSTIATIPISRGTSRGSRPPGAKRGDPSSTSSTFPRSRSLRSGRDSRASRSRTKCVPLPGEPVVQKSVSSAFIGTTLEADLRRRGVTTLVVVGMQTNLCVSTTARMAGNLGFTTYVVADATATFDNTGHDGRRYGSELIHDVALADLNGEFSTVVDTKTVLERAS